MPTKSPITIFCESKGISGQIKSAFNAYLRSHYSEKFGISENGETIHVIINRMSLDDLENAWQDFVRDLANYLTK